jgi:hypothetical protein
MLPGGTILPAHCRFGKPVSILAELLPQAMRQTDHENF